MLDQEDGCMETIASIHLMTVRAVLRDLKHVRRAVFSIYLLFFLGDYLAVSICDCKSTGNVSFYYYSKSHTAFSHNSEC